MEQNPEQFNSQPNGENYYTKKIPLPGGKIIEVVYFPSKDGLPLLDMNATDELSAELEPVSYEEGLNICPCCNSDLVYPRDWTEQEDDMWYIDLRCPDCDHTYDGVFDQKEVDLLVDALDDGTEEIMFSLRESMRLEVEKFIGALAANAIQPMDFASKAVFIEDKYPPPHQGSYPAW